jgi:uncharacterized protein
MDRFIVNVSDILEVTGGSLELEDDLTLDRLRVGDEEFVFTAQVRASVTLTNTSAGIVAAGTADTTVETECSRCLVRFEMPLSGEIEGFYVVPSRTGGLPEEQPYELIQDNKIDLLPAILQALAIEAPFAPVHEEDCKGICPTCGCDRNSEECNCEPESPGSPFEALKGLFDGQEGA